MSARDDYNGAQLGGYRYERMCDEIDGLREALDFYADPDTYFAVGFGFDRPCGGFDDDFSADHGGNYDREMPGARARAALRRHEATS